jgi:hypothetical protein
MTPLFQSSSYLFQPSTTTDTATYYSPVIDYFSIQPFDLIRIGSIFDPKPNYYTVISVDTYPYGTANAQQLSVPASIYTHFYSAYAMPPFTPGDMRSIITLPNTPDVYNFIQSALATPTREFCVTGSSVSSVNRRCYNIATDTPIVYQANQIWIPVTPNGWSTGFTPTVQQDQTNIPVTLYLGTSSSNNILSYKVQLDRIISGSGNLSQNFAILIPKPDETSVIVNFKKSLGDVSQTILIPQDASDEIKDSVGTIFQSLNVDLANQSIIKTQ